MKIYLVRHGETLWNSWGKIQTYSDHPGTYITPKGRTEARANATLFSDEPIQVIYHSALFRTKQTAEEIAGVLQTDPKIIEDPRINDGCLGFIDGLTVEEFRERFPEIYQAREDDKFNYKVPDLFPEQQYPTCESMVDVRDRARPFIEQVVSTGEDTVIVGHRGVNRVLLSELLNNSDFRIDPAIIGRVQVPTAGVYRMMHGTDMESVEYNIGNGWVEGLYLK